MSDQTDPLYLLPNLRAKDVEIEDLKKVIAGLKATNNQMRIENDILHKRVNQDERRGKEEAKAEPKSMA